MFFESKKSKPNDSAPAQIETTAAPVTEALIFICEKCGKKIGNADRENPSRDLQQDLKAMIRESGSKGVIRAALTSCIDLCPKNAIAVAIVDAGGTRKNQYLTLECYTDDAAEKILARAKKS